MTKKQEVLEVTLKSNSIIIQDSFLDSPLSNHKMVRYSGYLITDSSVSTGSFADVAEGLPSMESLPGGEWIALSSDLQGNYAITNDDAGFGRIYYAGVQSNEGFKLIVSSTFKSVSARLQSLGVRQDLNLPPLLASIFLNHVLFRSISSEETYSDSIRTLEPGKIILFNDSSVRINKQNFFHDPQGRSYQKLISDGIERATKQIISISKQDIRTKQINLSGGRDSRIALALLLASGKSTDFTVTSIDPTSKWLHPSAVTTLTRDLEISGKLGNYYGMGWTPPKQFTSEELTPYEMVEDWSANWSNRKSPVPGDIRKIIPAELEIAIRGGGGEILRSTDMAQNLASQVMTATGKLLPQVTLPDLAELWTKPVPDSIKSLVVDYIMRSFQGASLLGFKELINGHYATHRNRDHFGHLIPSLINNEMAWHPLSQPEFRYAAMTLSTNDRELDRLPIEIFNTTNPELAYLEFDSKQWGSASKQYRQDTNRNKVSGLRASVPDLETFFDYSKQNNENRQTALRNPKKTTTHLSLRDLTSFFSNDVKVKLSLLMSFSENLKNSEFSGITTHNIFHGRFKLQHYLMLIAHLESALDVFSVDNPSSVVNLNLSGRQVNLVPKFFNASESHAATSSSSDVTSPSTDVHTLTVSLQGRTITASIENLLDKSKGFLYAFYVFKNGIKIDQFWYSSKSSVQFNVIETGEKYFIKAFVKSREDQLFPIIIDSEPIEVT
ncbi:hypothetical protein ACTXJU_08860 [Glutamicibacter ardleyensis]|uniref:hypothetical protein n=1 Tax=Glutamicibacter ardleyensis TaxID=225894 RepID=UPI003FD6998D